MCLLLHSALLSSVPLYSAKQRGNIHRTTEHYHNMVTYMLENCLAQFKESPVFANNTAETFTYALKRLQNNIISHVTACWKDKIQKNSGTMG